MLFRSDLNETCRCYTVTIQSFRTDMPGQTMQIQFRVYTVCHSVCIVWTHYSMVEPHSSNFRVITTNILGVRIFRKFMVNQVRDKISDEFKTWPHYTFYFGVTCPWLPVFVRDSDAPLLPYDLLFGVFAVCSMTSITFKKICGLFCHHFKH